MNSYQNFISPYVKYCLAVSKQLKKHVSEDKKFFADTMNRMVNYGFANSIPPSDVAQSILRVQKIKEKELL